MPCGNGRAKVDPSCSPVEGQPSALGLRLWLTVAVTDLQGTWGPGCSGPCMGGAAHRAQQAARLGLHTYHGFPLSFLCLIVPVNFQTKGTELFQCALN